MSVDWYVSFGDKPGPFGDARPTAEQVGFVLEDFFGPAATVTHRPDNTWIVDLGPRPLRQPIGRCVGGPGGSLFDMLNPTAEDVRMLWPGHERRWFEVMLFPPGRSCSDLHFITRMQDEFTCSLVGGVAKVFARRWRGKLEEPS